MLTTKKNSPQAETSVQNWLPENKENAVLNTAVFDQLNLDYPGLEKVKQYHEAGEDYLAASALLEYYRMRANAENPALSLVNITLNKGNAR